jgi:hypothetical protein
MENHGTTCKRLLQHAIRMGKLMGIPEGRNHSEKPSVDGMIILKWIFGK